MTVDQQTNEVDKVKRFESGLILDPVTVSKEITIGELREIKSKYGFSGFPVIDNSNNLVGLITNRDIRFVEDDETKVSEVMTTDLVTVPEGIDKEIAKKMLHKNRIEKLLVVDSSGNYTYLLNKDVNFIREAYPNPTSTGLPKHYAYFDDDSFIVGPTPDAAYAMELHYGYYPQSIVTAGTTWLGNEFDSALLNGALVEAVRFMKGEPDIVANYDKMFGLSIGLLKNLGDGKLREDTYRSGQFRTPVS